MKRILLSGMILLCLALLAAAEAPLPKPIMIGAAVERSRVPAVLEQGKFLPPQSVSAVDVSGDGRRIAIATMAFRHDRNFWVLSDEGKILWSRYVLPWAPYQVGTTGRGGRFATGLAYSRITPPFPTISIFQDDQGAETALTDNAGERGWLRYGGGAWRTGWLVSALGDQVVRSDESVFTITGNSGAWKLTDAEVRKLPPLFPTQRPYRLASSGDGRTLAFGYVVPDVSRLEKGTVPESFRVQLPDGLVTVRNTADWKEVGNVKPSSDIAPLAPLPDPAKDYPELAEKFSLQPAAVLPFRVAASLAVNADGSRVAIVEYAGWLWIRARPAIGTWDPPYHVIPFMPRQRGWLRVVGASGAEVVRTPLPKEGWFDVKLDSRGERATCYPASWFARGMAGCAWRPADDDAHTIFGFDVANKRWTSVWELPDAVADLALQPEGGRALVSCWDGKLYMLDQAGKSLATVAVHGPARLQWSKDGGYAVAGTQDGEVLSLGADGKLRWRIKLPEAELPPLKQPVQRVFDEVPIYQVGRTGPEHAYVGDTWLVKSGRGGILIDAGGTSSIPFTLQRIKSAAVDLKEVRYLLHTHSHGDHCGAGYLWRTLGLKVVAPQSADLALAWLMPMLTDYGVWVPRPVDVPLPLKRAGDEMEITLGDLKIRAVFVPGHSYDSVIYALEVEGKRVVFTGDIGFDNQREILHRCWGDVAKAKAVTEAVRSKIIPYKPAFVFRGHGAKRDGAAWIEDLVQRSEEAIRKAESEKK